ARRHPRDDRPRIQSLFRRRALLGDLRRADPRERGMTRGVGRALAAAALGALLGVAWLALFYAMHPALDISFDTDPPKLLTGVYRAERDRQTDLTFAWPGADLTLRLPGLDRSVRWLLTARLRGARADPRQNPVVTFRADDAVVDTRPSKSEFETVQVE